MNSKKFWLFSGLIIIFFQLSAADANAVHGYESMPSPGQYSGTAQRFVTNPQAFYNPGVSWRTTPQQSWPQHRPGYNAYKPRYRFRPWQRNYRYQPRFPQQQVNYQAQHYNYQVQHYRWRPLLPPQSSHQWNRSRQPEYQVGYYPSVQAYPVFMPRALGQGVRHNPPPARVSYTAYPPVQMSRPNPRVYRSAEITIPNHYVFRPLNPKRQVNERARFVDDTQRRQHNRSSVSQHTNVGGYRFRPAPLAQGMHGVHSKMIASDLRTSRESRGTERAKFNGRPVFNPLANRMPTDSFHTRPDSAYRHQYRPFPPVGYRYPLNPGYGRPMVSYRPVQGAQPVYPYALTPYYSANRYQQEMQAQKVENSNAYDGVPDSIGSWYKSGDSAAWPMLSQSRQMELPLAEFDGTSF